jgi:hypothetical protein
MAHKASSFISPAMVAQVSAKAGVFLSIVIYGACIGCLPALDTVAPAHDIMPMIAMCLKAYISKGVEVMLILNS